jgi:integrase
MMVTRRRFGRVRQLPSGRWQARYHGPDGYDYPAPETFDRKTDADRWLSTIETELLAGDWSSPDAGLIPLGDFARRWVAERAGLRPKTRQLYEGLVRLHMGPTFGACFLADITAPRVRSWRAELLDRGVGEVTVAKCYRLLRTILATAVDDNLIRVNPCQIKGAAVERSPERPTLTVVQVYALADAMPPRYRMLVLLATMCSLRWGELAALTRQDLDVRDGWVQVRHAMVELADGSLAVGPPKTAAGRRVVAIPGSLVADVGQHLARFVGRGDAAWVFAGPKGGVLRRSNFQQHWGRALAAAGISGVHFHDLRHTGNTLTAQSGATLPDLMARMGHASTRAALIYLHTSSRRDRAVADSLNRLLPTSGATGDRARGGHGEPFDQEEEQAVIMGSGL